MTLQAKLDAFKADFQAGKPPYNVPPSVIETMHRATAELVANGAATRALKAGDKAPAFMLDDPERQPISSADLLARAPLVVSFYRGVWCPYCNMELQALQSALPEFEKLGASLVAISPQTAANSRKAVRQNELGFPILSDPHNEVAAAFGLRFELPDYLADLYKSLKNDLPSFNGETELLLDAVTLESHAPKAGAGWRHDEEEAQLVIQLVGLVAGPRPANCDVGQSHGAGLSSRGPPRWASCQI